MEEPITNKKMTEEHKRKISEALKGRPKSDEMKRKLSEKARGRKVPPRSPEHAKKIAEAHARRRIMKEKAGDV